MAASPGGEMAVAPSAAPGRPMDSAAADWVAFRPMPLRVRLSLLAAVAVACTAVLAGCASLADGGPAATRTPAPVDRITATNGRILVLAANGGLFTVAPDGQGRIDLQDGGGGRRAQQPTWSPDASRVAWVEVTGRGSDERVALVTARADGSGRAEAPLDAPAFFLSWDPTSMRVAYLVPSGRTGTALGVVDTAGDPTRARVIAGGQPLYFDWQPDGGGVFLHAGGDLLGNITVNGASQPIAQSGGRFRAPQWSANAAGDLLLYAAQHAGQQTLVAALPNGARHDVLRFDGEIAFAVSPDARRLAYQAQPLQPQPVSRGQTVALSTSSRQAPLAITDALVVQDLATGRPIRVTQTPVAAFFWSPDSRRLLYLSVERDAKGIQTRWSIWDGHRTTRLDAFAPSLELARDYLPAFDQYARALSLWSPDGSQFVYAGSDGEGESGVWVQSVDSTAAPIRIADGVFAAWSPRPTP